MEDAGTILGAEPEELRDPAEHGGSRTTPPLSHTPRFGPRTAKDTCPPPIRRRDLTRLGRSVRQRQAVAKRSRCPTNDLLCAPGPSGGYLYIDASQQRIHSCRSITRSLTSCRSAASAVLNLSHQPILLASLVGCSGC